MEVAAAVILSGNGVLCFRKGESKFGYLTGSYEFPGGKLEPGETPQEALIRELSEELDLEVRLDELEEYCTLDHNYPDFSVKIHYFLIHRNEVDYTLKEHTDCTRSDFSDLLSLNWLGADLEVVKMLVGEHSGRPTVKARLGTRFHRSISCYF